MIEHIIFGTIYVKRDNTEEGYWVLFNYYETIGSPYLRCLYFTSYPGFMERRFGDYDSVFFFFFLRIDRSFS